MYIFFNNIIFSRLAYFLRYNIKYLILITLHIFKILHFVMLYYASFYFNIINAFYNIKILFKN